MIDAKAVGLEIKARRQKLGLSQVDFARALGVHSQTVSRYETGDIRLTTDRLLQIAKALGTDVPGLLGRNPTPEELPASEPPDLPQEAVSLIFDYLAALAQSAPLAEVEAMRARLLSPEGVLWYSQFPGGGTDAERTIAGVKAVISQQFERLQKERGVPIHRDPADYYDRIATKLESGNEARKGTGTG